MCPSGSHLYGREYLAWHAADPTANPGNWSVRTPCCGHTGAQCHALLLPHVLRAGSVTRVDKSVSCQGRVDGKCCVNSAREPTYCWFCGGTHAVMLHYEALSSVQRMYELNWRSAKGWNELDCVIGDTLDGLGELHHYCVNWGLVKYGDFGSDIIGGTKN